MIPTLPRPLRRVALPALAAAALGVGVAASARADERLPADLFGGYSFAQISDVSRHGGDVASSFHLFGPLSGFVDASVHFGSSDSLDRSDLTLMAGPGARFGRAGGTVFFARALAGLVRDRASVSVYDVDIAESDSRFGVMAGGGIDIPFAARWAVRVQADYLWNDAGADEASPPAAGDGLAGIPGAGVTKSGFRASAGIVYRFGARP